MKKILLRCSALMVAAFVLLGSVLLAAPVKASAVGIDGYPEFPSAVTTGYGASFFLCYLDTSGSTVLFTSVDIPDIVWSDSSLQLSSDYAIDAYKKYTLSGSTWVAGSTRNGKYSVKISLYNSEASSILCCCKNNGDSLDIYDAEGNLFFPPPPPPEVDPLVEVMTDLKEQNQLSQVLTQVVTIIPIGLGCLVGYKGLRKALDLLQRILHQA